jgi:hypothetical protein
MVVKGRSVQDMHRLVLILEVLTAVCADVNGR